MAIRAFLCWALATSVTGDSPWLFAAALGRPGLVQGVRRHPRRGRPPAASARLHAGARQRSGVTGGDRRRDGVGADRRPALPDRAGVVAALRVRRVHHRHRLRHPAPRTGRLLRRGGRAGAARLGGDHQPSGRAKVRIPPAVAFALRANCGPRWLSGFLIMFMAFLLRENPPASALQAEVLIGLVIGAAGAGNALGILLASLLKQDQPGGDRRPRAGHGGRGDAGLHPVLRRADRSSCSG